MARIAAAGMPRRVYPAPRRVSRDGVQHVLHVVTEALDIGGLTKMLIRWLEDDHRRQHSVALTNQRQRIPDELKDLVARRGGAVHYIGETVGGQLARARTLRDLAGGFDLLVLHTYPDDPIAALSFADRAWRPTTALLDHAHHAFWLSMHTSYLVISLRAAGMGLAIDRRGVERERNCLLPIPLDFTERKLPRAAAKQALGIPDDALVVASVARPGKYRDVAGQRYIDCFVPFLREHGNAVVLLVGAGPRQDWADVTDEFADRLRVLPRTGETRVFFEASDIYVDSFPFVSNTSLLEGGMLGNPVISRIVCGDALSVLDCDMPGVASSLIRHRSPEELGAELAALARDPERRSALGNATRQEIRDTHSDDEWRAALERVYDKARTVSAGPQPAVLAEQPCFSSFDAWLAATHAWQGEMNQLLCLNLRSLPIRDRFKFLREFCHTGLLESFRSFSAERLILRAWLACRVGRRLRA